MDEILIIDTDDKLIPELLLKVAYLPLTGNFKVQVIYKDTKKEEFFPANFEPRYGIDVLDHSIAMKIADKFATEIETEFNLPKYQEEE